MFSRVVKYIFFVSLASSIVAIEGQNPTPRFISPDFSVEEERVAYPSDLLEFFKIPFIEYLRQDTSRAVLEPTIEINSSKGAAGGVLFSRRGMYLDIDGDQAYHGTEEISRLLRFAEGYGGYATIIEEKFPVNIYASGKYSMFRGEYTPSTYDFTTGLEGHVPISKNLLSMNLSATRESWAQRIGPVQRVEPLDRERAEISNSLGGEAIFRSMPGEYTGFEIFAGAVTSTRYEQNRWELVRTVTMGGADLVYDSRPLRLSVGASLHRTWQKTTVSPKMTLELVWKKFSAFASADGYTSPIERYNTLPSPRASIPQEADFIRVPIALEAGGIIELKSNQLLHFRADYMTAENEPVLWNPLAEAPKASLEEARHQSFEIKLDSDFGILKNKLSILLKRDIVGDTNIPIEPEEVFSDTISLEISDFTILAGGYRRYGQPFLVKPQETNISFGISYSFSYADFTLLLENILGEPIFDERSLEFSDDIRLAFRVARKR